MLLANPPSYLTAAQFGAMGNDNAQLLAQYSAPVLQTKLNAASGVANSIMKRNQLAQERTADYYGDDSPVLDLGTRPLIYVRQIQFVQPGVSGFILPTANVLIDNEKGTLETYAPIMLQGVGFYSIFPRGVKFAVTFGSGYGFNPTTAPNWSSADALGGGGLAPGAYVIGITSRTQWGETLPAIKSVTTANGAIQATIVGGVLGAFKYRVFGAPGATSTTSADAAAAATTLTLQNGQTAAAGSTIVLDPMGAAAETVVVQSAAANVLTLRTPLVNAHAAGTLVSPQLSLIAEIPATLFGDGNVGMPLTSMSPPSGYFPEFAPIADTSALPVPWELQEATRLLLLSSIYEQNNLANRGIAGTSSGRKRTQWRPTDGSSGRGVPTLWSQASEMLQPRALSGIFGK